MKKWIVAIVVVLFSVSSYAGKDGGNDQGSGSSGNGGSDGGNKVASYSN